ncbi:unnamed protein product [Somion occarium]|uniref:F-box domain-containing protein n=1 Tax=Somion occarium TaxID=3059160 RepID=A0ABP1CVT2_9APHY
MIRFRTLTYFLIYLSDTDMANVVDTSLCTSNLCGWKVPQELIDSIIDELHEDVAALRACALVSSAWLLRSRRGLFHSLTLICDAHTKDIHEFIRFLRSSYPVGACVRHLDMRSCNTTLRAVHDPFAPPPRLVPQGTVALECIKDVVALLPNLLTLMLVGLRWREVYETLGMFHKHNLQKLIISDVTSELVDNVLSPAAIAQLIDLFPFLQVLELSNIWIIHQPYAAPSIVTFLAPETLIVSDHLHFKYILIEAVRYLRILSSIDGTISAVLDSRQLQPSNITTLEVGTNTEFRLPTDASTKLAASLRSHPNLQTLVFRPYDEVKCAAKKEPLHPRQILTFCQNAFDIITCGPPALCHAILILSAEYRRGMRVQHWPNLKVMAGLPANVQVLVCEAGNAKTFSARCDCATQWTLVGRVEREEGAVVFRRVAEDLTSSVIGGLG